MEPWPDVVSNGQEAVAALVQQSYGLILMDCQMPELDGFAATAAIRQREGDQHHTLIMAMTANTMPGDREHCLAAGIDDYISKPITLNVLRDKLALWLPADSGAVSEVEAAAASTMRAVASPALSPELPDPLDRERVETVRELLEMEIEFTRVHAALAHMCHVETASATTPHAQ